MRLTTTRLVTGAATMTLAVGLSAACGDVYADPQGTVIQPPAQADASSSFTLNTPLFCPEHRPRENSPCTAVGSTCEYGTSADPSCNAVLTCRGSASDAYWERVPSGVCHERACPELADVETLDGKPCAIEPPDGGTITDADEAVCDVSDGVCICTTGPGGAGAHPRSWVCVRPVATCPAARPLAGRSCVSDLFCDYGNCASKRGPLMECESGMWVTGGQTCP